MYIARVSTRSSLRLVSSPKVFSSLDVTRYHPILAAGYVSDPVLHRSKASRQLGDYPIPSLPEVPPSPPTMVSREEATKYLVPLCRRGWAAHNRLVDRTNADGTAEKYSGKVLKNTFWVNDTATSLAWLEELAAIALSENQPFNLIGLDSNAVKFQTSTPDAIVPYTDEKLLWVTLRDIRVAILAETKFSEKYITTGLASPSMQRAPPSKFTKAETFLTAPNPRPISPMTAKDASPSPSRDPLPNPQSPPVSKAETSVGDEDIALYLNPLYTRKWTVDYFHKAGPGHPLSSRLMKSFQFDSDDSALAFSLGASKIAIKEHDDIAFVIHAGMLNFYTTGIAKQEITYRDIRTAILVEEYLAGHTDKLVPIPAGYAHETCQPSTVAEMKEEYASHVDKSLEKITPRARQPEAAEK